MPLSGTEHTSKGILNVAKLATFPRFAANGAAAALACGVTEVRFLVHARRYFFDLHAANQSQIARSAGSVGP